jgi:hypothetical protein
LQQIVQPLAVFIPRLRRSTADCRDDSPHFDLRICRKTSAERSLPFTPRSPAIPLWRALVKVLEVLRRQSNLYRRPRPPRLLQISVAKLQSPDVIPIFQSRVVHGDLISTLCFRGSQSNDNGDCHFERDASI